MVKILRKIGKKLEKLWVQKSSRALFSDAGLFEGDSQNE